jgi:hypothetical protein
MIDAGVRPAKRPDSVRNDIFELAHRIHVIKNVDSDSQSDPSNALAGQGKMAVRVSTSDRREAFGTSRTTTGSHGESTNGSTWRMIEVGAPLDFRQPNANQDARVSLYSVGCSSRSVGNAIGAGDFL